MARLAPGAIEVDVPVLTPGPFPTARGERWSYAFSWSGIPVGKASITVDRERVQDEKRVAMTVRGGTNAFIDLFWRYRLQARGSLRLDPFGPAEFVSEEQENKHHKTTRIEFSRKGQVYSLRGKDESKQEYHFAVTNTQDILSTVYLVLSFDYKPGRQFRFDTFTGTARYLVTVMVEDREAVRIQGQPIDSYRLRIVTADLTNPGQTPKHRETQIWVSAGMPRRLLRARSKTFIGSVYGELVSVEPIDPVDR